MNTSLGWEDIFRYFVPQRTLSWSSQTIHLCLVSTQPATRESTTIIFESMKFINSQRIFTDLNSKITREPEALPSPPEFPSHPSHSCRLRTDSSRRTPVAGVAQEEESRSPWPCARSSPSRRRSLQHTHRCWRGREELLRESRRKEMEHHTHTCTHLALSRCVRASFSSSARTRGTHSKARRSCVISLCLSDALWWDLRGSFGGFYARDGSLFERFYRSGKCAGPFWLLTEDAIGLRQSCRVKMDDYGIFGDTNLLAVLNSLIRLIFIVSWKVFYVIILCLVLLQRACLFLVEKWSFWG